MRYWHIEIKIKIRIEIEIQLKVDIDRPISVHGCMNIYLYMHIYI